MKKKENKLWTFAKGAAGFALGFVTAPVGALVFATTLANDILLAASYEVSKQC